MGGRDEGPEQERDKTSREFETHSRNSPLEGRGRPRAKRRGDMPPWWRPPASEPRSAAQWPFAGAEVEAEEEEPEPHQTQRTQPGATRMATSQPPIEYAGELIRRGRNPEAAQRPLLEPGDQIEHHRNPLPAWF